MAVDFFTVDTIWLQRLYILFFIELGSRRVHVAKCTANPTAPWVVQQAKQLSWTLAERAEPIRFLIRDRDQKFTDAFDGVSRADGIEVVRTPFRAPQVNGVAERFVRTARSECFDPLLTLNHEHLERICAVFIDHYNRHRAHRALSLTPPEPRRAVAAVSARHDARILRRDRLGGVVHEYELMAVPIEKAVRVRICVGSRRLFRRLRDGRALRAHRPTAVVLTIAQERLRRCAVDSLMADEPAV